MALVWRIEYKCTVVYITLYYITALYYIFLKIKPIFIVAQIFLTFCFFNQKPKFELCLFG